MSSTFALAVHAVTHVECASLDKFSPSRVSSGKTKLRPGYTSLPLCFCHLPLSGRHVTSLNQGLSSLTPFGVGDERPWEREILTAFLPSPTFLVFILSLQPLRPTTQILRRPCFSVVANSKICRGRSRNSSAVESQSYFVSGRLF